MASDYVVEAHSRENLRSYALLLRKALGLESTVYFPVVQVLDYLSLVSDFNYIIVTDGTLPSGKPAGIDMNTNDVLIEESIYSGAVNGNGMERMTIAHEISHFYTLCYLGFEWHENTTHEEYPAYMDPE